jgi:hypothetical protein
MATVLPLPLALFVMIMANTTLVPTAATTMTTMTITLVINPPNTLVTVPLTGAM